METSELSLEELRKELDDLYTEFAKLKREKTLQDKKYHIALKAVKTARANSSSAEQLIDRYKRSVVTTANHEAVLAKLEEARTQCKSLEDNYNNLVNSSSIKYQKTCGDYINKIAALQLGRNMLQDEDNQPQLQQKRQTRNKRRPNRKLQHAYDNSVRQVEKLKAKLEELRNKLKYMRLGEQNLKQREMSVRAVEKLKAKLEELRSELKYMRVNYAEAEVSLKDKYDKGIYDLKEENLKQRNLSVREVEKLNAKLEELRSELKYMRVNNATADVSLKDKYEKEIYDLKEENLKQRNLSVREVEKLNAKLEELRSELKYMRVNNATADVSLKDKYEKEIYDLKEENLKRRNLSVREVEKLNAKLEELRSELKHMRVKNAAAEVSLKDKYEKENRVLSSNDKELLELVSCNDASLQTQLFTRPTQKRQPVENIIIRRKKMSMHTQTDNGIVKTYMTALTQTEIGRKTNSPPRVDNTGKITKVKKMKHFQTLNNGVKELAIQIPDRHLSPSIVRLFDKESIDYQDQKKTRMEKTKLQHQQISKVSVSDCNFIVPLHQNVTKQHGSISDPTAKRKTPKIICPSRSVDKSDNFNSQHSELDTSSQVNALELGDPHKKKAVELCGSNSELDTSSSPNKSNRKSETHKKATSKLFGSNSVFDTSSQINASELDNESHKSKAIKLLGSDSELDISSAPNKSNSKSETHKKVTLKPFGSDSDCDTSSQIDTEVPQSSPEVKRKRGRPRKTTDTNQKTSDNKQCNKNNNAMTLGFQGDKCIITSREKPRRKTSVVVKNSMLDKELRMHRGRINPTLKQNTDDEESVTIPRSSQGKANFQIRSAPCSVCPSHGGVTSSYRSASRNLSNAITAWEKSVQVLENPVPNTIKKVACSNDDVVQNNGKRRIAHVAKHDKKPKLSNSDSQLHSSHEDSSELSDSGAVPSSDIVSMSIESSSLCGRLSEQINGRDKKSETAGPGRASMMSPRHSSRINAEKFAASIASKGTERKSFKRPLCKKRSLHLESPASPETHTEVGSVLAPKAIPVGKVPAVAESRPKVVQLQIIPEVAQMSVDQGKRLLEEMLQFHEEQNIITVARSFMGQKPEFVVKLVLQRALIDYQAELVKRKATTELVLTVTQDALLKLMVALEKLGGEDVCNTFLDVVEDFLPTLDDPVPLWPITSLYVAICRFKGHIWRMRKMLCNSLTSMSDLAIPFINIVLQQWLEVMPSKQSPRHESLFVKAIMQLVLLKSCSKPGYNLCNLRQLLLCYYGYPSDMHDSKKLLLELFNSYIEDGNECYETLALALSQTMDKKWVFNQIEKTIKRKAQETNNVYQLCGIVKLVASVTKFYSKTLNASVTKNNRQWLKSFCVGPFPDCVREGAMRALSRLSKKA